MRQKAFPVVIVFTLGTVLTAALSDTLGSGATFLVGLVALLAVIGTAGATSDSNPRSWQPVVSYKCIALIVAIGIAISALALILSTGAAISAAVLTAFTLFGLLNGSV